MRRDTSHIAMGKNSFRCLNCGGEFQLPLPVSITMFGAMGKGFTAEHAACKPSAKGAAKMASNDVFVWYRNWDTGMSSKTIWHFMMPGFHATPDYYPAIPHDPADFGRCHRLLKIAPEWRARLDEMGAAIPCWKPFADVWAQMERLYEEELPSGNAPKLYALMQQCVEQAESTTTTPKDPTNDE